MRRTNYKTCFIRLVVLAKFTSSDQPRTFFHFSILLDLLGREVESRSRNRTRQLRQRPTTGENSQKRLKNTSTDVTALQAQGITGHSLASRCRRPQKSLGRPFVSLFQSQLFPLISSLVRTRLALAKFQLYF